MGNADTVIFRNNISLGDCQRIFTVIGDEPATGPPNSTNYPPGETPCRASGDQNFVAMSNYGTYIFQGNTFAGYGATGIDEGCGVGWDNCAQANSVFENNVVMGISYTQYNVGNITPGLFYWDTSKDTIPPNSGWATRDHNIYFGWKNGPCIDGVLPTEICADPKFVNEPANTISDDSLLDNYNFNLTSISQAKFTGTYISATSPDQNGTPRANPPSMGALEYITNIIRHLFGGSSSISGSGSIN
jgi:hypothetical protein